MEQCTSTNTSCMRTYVRISYNKIAVYNTVEFNRNNEVRKYTYSIRESNEDFTVSILLVMLN